MQMALYICTDIYRFRRNTWFIEIYVLCYTCF